MGIITIYICELNFNKCIDAVKKFVEAEMPFDSELSQFEFDYVPSSIGTCIYSDDIDENNPSLIKLFSNIVEIELKAYYAGDSK